MLESPRQAESDQRADEVASEPPPLAVITGAARGIGAATALALARDGWSLLLIDACAAQPGITYAMPGARELGAVAERGLAAGASSAQTLVADVACGDFCGRVRDALAGRTPAAAVAAAGVIAGGPAWATSDQAWATLIDVNLHGTRRLAEATVPAMVAAGRGRFIAIASAAALRALAQLAAYSAAKAAVAGFIRALAADLAGTGVTANAICPGSTRGPMLSASAALYDLPDERQFAEQHLLRRVLEPAEVASAVAWLCGPGGSAVTGAVLPIDGGLTA